MYQFAPEGALYTRNVETPPTAGALSALPPTIRYISPVADHAGQQKYVEELPPPAVGIMPCSEHLTDKM